MTIAELIRTLSCCDPEARIRIAIAQGTYLNEFTVADEYYQTINMGDIVELRGKKEAGSQSEFPNDRPSHREIQQLRT